MFIERNRFYETTEPVDGDEEACTLQGGYQSEVGRTSMGDIILTIIIIVLNIFQCVQNSRTWTATTFEFENLQEATDVRGTKPEFRKCTDN